MQKHNIEDFGESGHVNKTLSASENLYQPELFENAFPKIEDRSLSLTKGEKLKFTNPFLIHQTESKTDDARVSDTDDRSQVDKESEIANRQEFQDGLRKTSFPNENVDFSQFSNIAQRLGFSNEIARSSFDKLNPDENDIAAADGAAETLTVMTLADLKSSTQGDVVKIGGERSCLA